MVNEEFVNRLLKNSKAFGDLINGREIHIRFNQNSFEVFLINDINTLENTFNVTKIFTGSVSKIAVNDIYQLVISSVNKDKVMGAYEYFTFESNNFVIVLTQVKCANRDINCFYILENKDAQSIEELLDQNNKKLITDIEYKALMDKNKKVKKRIIGRIN